MTSITSHFGEGTVTGWRVALATLMLVIGTMATFNSNCTPIISTFSSPSLKNDYKLLFCKPNASEFVYETRQEQTGILTFTCVSDKPNKWIWASGSVGTDISVTKEVLSPSHLQPDHVYISNITILFSEVALDPIDTNLSCSFVSTTEKWAESTSTCVQILYDYETQLPDSIRVIYDLKTSNCFPYISRTTEIGSIGCATKLSVNINQNLALCNNSKAYHTTCNDLDECGSNRLLNARLLEGMLVCEGMVTPELNATSLTVLRIPTYLSPVFVYCNAPFPYASTRTAFLQLWPVISFDTNAAEEVTYVTSLDSVSNHAAIKVVALPFGVKQKAEGFNLAMFKDHINRTRKFLAQGEEVIFLCVAIKYWFMRGFKWSINNTTVEETMSVYDKSQPIAISELRINMSIFLHSVHPLVSCSAPIWNTEQRATQEVSFVINESNRPTADVICDDETNSLAVSCTCQYTGDPSPLTLWSVEVVDSLVVEIVSFSKVESSNYPDSSDGFEIIRFTRPFSSNSYPTRITCSLENFKGTHNATYFLKGISSQKTNPLWWLLTAVVCVVLLATGVFIFCKYWSSREEQRNLTDAETHQFFEGLPGAHQHSLLYRFSNVDFLPYKKQYEICADDIKYDNSNKQLLGCGHFSIVLRGKLESKAVSVAIKIPKPSMNVSLFKAMLSEVKIMMYAGSHENLVHLIGICTENIQSRSLLIVTEICELGSLHNLLRDAPATFLNLLNANQEIDTTMLSSLDASQRLSTLDLVVFSAQVANGMSYLAEKNIIHGDLASRNVLISSNKCAKISDFGLSKQLYDEANYVKKTKTPLPWRWMAIESLTKMTFSPRSDVWAYGVTLYEIFSLGDIPFPNETWINDFVARLASGMRMGRPKYSSSAIYAKMVACWEQDPENRPDFASLYEFFGNLQIKFSSESNHQNGCHRLEDNLAKETMATENSKIFRTSNNLNTSAYLELIDSDPDNESEGFDTSTEVDGEAHTSAGADGGEVKNPNEQACYENIPQA